MLTAHVAVAALFSDHPPLKHVAVLVAVGGFPQRAPAAHVAPAGIQRQHRPQGCFFHHRHIDRDVRALGEGFPLQPQKVQIGAVLLQCRPAAADHIRHEPFQLGEHGAGFEQKHAAVPGEATCGQKLLGCVPVRFFHEPRDRHLLELSSRQGFSGFDVAVTGFRGCRHNPKRHQPAGLRGGAASGHGSLELLGIAD